MKTPSLLRFVCLVCAWTSTLAEYVQVHRAPGVRAPGIKGCLPSPVSSYNVRLQSLKTSGGSVYTQQLVTTVDLPCFESIGTSATLDATTIVNCAEATAKKGLNSFSWENGACTAYLAWRPEKRADCKDDGSKVVYVVKKPLTPFEGGRIIVSGEINYADALPLAFLDISHQYDFCGFSSRITKGYKLLINGSDAVMLPEGNATYSLSLKVLCSRSTNLSLWSVGADGEVNSDEVQVTYTGGRSSGYYGLTTGGCLYEAHPSGNYLDTLQYCNSTASGTLYFEKEDGGASAFLVALMDSKFPASMDGFYVGLRWVAEGQWKWLGGLPQPSDDIIWDDPLVTGTYDCAKARMGNGKWQFFPVANCSASISMICYFEKP